MSTITTIGENGARANAFADAVQRAKADYLEMPGLQLTAAQAMRLWAYDAALCKAVLSTLVQSQFLIHTRKETFARP